MATLRTANSLDAVVNLDQHPGEDPAGTLRTKAYRGLGPFSLHIHRPSGHTAFMTTTSENPGDLARRVARRRTELGLDRRASWRNKRESTRRILDTSSGTRTPDSVLALSRSSHSP